MEIRNLKTFLTVARLLNFRQSAEILNYSQSTVSAQVKILEEELGKPLFLRKGRTIALTEAGNNLVPYANKMAALETEAMAIVSEMTTPRGKLSLRMPQTLGTYFLPEILQKYCQLFPNIDFEIASCEYQKLPVELKAGITDLAFLLADSTDFSELNTECVGTVNLVFLCSPLHRLSREKIFSISNLTDQTVFLPLHDCSYKMMLEQWLEQEKTEVASLVQMNSIESIKHCVGRGLGITIMPDIAAAEEIAQGKLCILNWDQGTLESAILMIWHKATWLSPLLKTFMEHVRSVLRKKNLVTP